MSRHYYQTRISSSGTGTLMFIKESLPSKLNNRSDSNSCDSNKINGVKRSVESTLQNKLIGTRSHKTTLMSLPPRSPKPRNRRPKTVDPSSQPAMDTVPQSTSEQASTTVIKENTGSETRIGTVSNSNNVSMQSTGTTNHKPVARHRSLSTHSIITQPHNLNDLRKFDGTGASTSNTPAIIESRISKSEADSSTCMIDSKKVPSCDIFTTFHGIRRCQAALDNASRSKGPVSETKLTIDDNSDMVTEVKEAVICSNQVTSTTADVDAILPSHSSISDPLLFSNFLDCVQKYNQHQQQQQQQQQQPSTSDCRQDESDRNPMDSGLQDGLSETDWDVNLDDSVSNSFNSEEEDIDDAFEEVTSIEKGEQSVFFRHKLFNYNVKRKLTNNRRPLRRKQRLDIYSEKQPNPTINTLNVNELNRPLRLVGGRYEFPVAMPNGTVEHVYIMKEDFSKLQHVGNERLPLRNLSTKDIDTITRALLKNDDLSWKCLEKDGILYRRMITSSADDDDDDQPGTSGESHLTDQNLVTDTSAAVAQQPEPESFDWNAFFGEVDDLPTLEFLGVKSTPAANVTPQKARIGRTSDEITDTVIDVLDEPGTKGTDVVNRKINDKQQTTPGSQSAVATPRRKKYKAATRSSKSPEKSRTPKVVDKPVSESEPVEKPSAKLDKPDTNKAKTDRLDTFSKLMLASEKKSTVPKRQTKLSRVKKRLFPVETEVVSQPNEDDDHDAKHAKLDNVVDEEIKTNPSKIDLNEFNFEPEPEIELNLQMEYTDEEDVGPSNIVNDQSQSTNQIDQIECNEEMVAKPKRIRRNELDHLLASSPEWPTTMPHDIPQDAALNDTTKDEIEITSDNEDKLFSQDQPELNQVYPASEVVDTPSRIVTRDLNQPTTSKKVRRKKGKSRYAKKSTSKLPSALTKKMELDPFLFTALDCDGEEIAIDTERSIDECDGVIQIPIVSMIPVLDPDEYTIDEVVHDLMELVVADPHRNIDRVPTSSDVNQSDENDINKIEAFVVFQAGFNFDIDIIEEVGLRSKCSKQDDSCITATIIKVTNDCNNDLYDDVTPTSSPLANSDDTIPMQQSESPDNQGTNLDGMLNPFLLTASQLNGTTSVNGIEGPVIHMTDEEEQIHQPSSIFYAADSLDTPVYHHFPHDDNSTLAAINSTEAHTPPSCGQPHGSSNAHCSIQASSIDALGFMMNNDVTSRDQDISTATITDAADSSLCDPDLLSLSNFTNDWPPMEPIPNMNVNCGIMSDHHHHNTTHSQYSQASRIDLKPPATVDILQAAMYSSEAYLTSEYNAPQQQQQQHQHQQQQRQQQAVSNYGSQYAQYLSTPQPPIEIISASKSVEAMQQQTGQSNDQVISNICNNDLLWSRPASTYHTMQPAIISKSYDSGKVKAYWDMANSYQQQQQMKQYYGYNPNLVPTSNSYNRYNNLYDQGNRLTHSTTQYAAGHYYQNSNGQVAHKHRPLTNIRHVSQHQYKFALPAAVFNGMVNQSNTVTNQLYPTGLPPDVMTSGQIPQSYVSNGQSMDMQQCMVPIANVSQQQSEMVVMPSSLLEIPSTTPESDQSFTPAVEDAGEWLEKFKDNLPSIDTNNQERLNEYSNMLALCQKQLKSKMKIPRGRARSNDGRRSRQPCKAMKSRGTTPDVNSDPSDLQQQHQQNIEQLGCEAGTSASNVISPEKSSTSDSPNMDDNGLLSE